MKLRAIAHSRSGDKGTIVNVSLIVFDPRHYPFILRHVTAERVKSHFADLATGDVFDTNCRVSVRSTSLCTALPAAA